MASLTILTKPVHPAIYTSHLPPLTPTYAVTTPLTGVPKHPVPPPRYNNAMLRASHAHMLRYMIAKLRWEQTNNAYLRGEKAWNIHNRIIADMEIELKACEEARKTLDRFPNVQAPMWYPEPHGPETKEEWEAERKAEEKAQKMRDRKLEEHFPWMRQLFIGPKTKAQARNDRLLREQLMNNHLDDVETLLPSANFRMLMEMEEGLKDGKGEQKKPYEQERLDKERARIANLAKGEDVDPGAGPSATPRKVTSGGTGGGTGKQPPFIGPLTKDEFQFQLQREERHIVLNYLRQPWPKFNEPAANSLSKLARVALIQADEGKGKKGDSDGKEGRDGKDGKEGKEVKGEKEGKGGEKEGGKEKTGEKPSKDIENHNPVAVPVA